jgi:hypothetical protein
MHPFFLPFRETDYTSDLSPAEIEARLQENVITGFSVYSKKPYYGSYSSYGFTARRVSNRFKKQSLSATVEGAFGLRDGETRMNLRMRPNPLLMAFFGVMCVPIALLVLAGLSEFFKTWDLALTLSGCVPAGVAYFIFCLIFYTQFNSAQRFREHALELQNINGRNLPPSIS